MFLDGVLFLGGLALLYLGAEILVRGASRLAEFCRITPLVVGLTVVAFGTSAPELFVSAFAAMRREADIALGNVIGSNIANIGLILGLAAVVSTVECHVKTIRREVPIMIGATLLVALMSLNGVIGVWDGIILFSALVAFGAYSYVSGRKEFVKLPDTVKREFQPHSRCKPRDLVKYISLTLLGVILLVVSARIVLDSAVVIAEVLGISHKVVAISMIALGTSLPELATSVVAVLRDEPDISVGNIIGSCIFNVLCVLGAVSFLEPIAVDPNYIWDFLVMFLLSVLLIPLMLSGSRVSRPEGILLLVLYGGYITALMMQKW